MLLFLKVAAVTHGFFVPMFELYYSAALLVLFNAIRNKKSGYISLSILLVLAFFILTAHLYAFILMAFVFLINEKIIHKNLIISLLHFVGLMIVIILYKSVSSSEYEKGVINQFMYQLKHKELNLSYLKSLIYFLVFFHWKGLVLLVITSVLLIIQKNYRLLLLFLVFFIGTLTIASFLSSSFDPSRYNEQVYFPLWFLVIFTLFYGAFNTIISPLKQWFLLGFIIIGMCTIFNIEFYSNRLTEIHSIIEDCDKRNGNKFYIPEEDLIYDANWSYPIETLLFSAAKGKKSSLTVCVDTDLKFQDNFKQIKSKQFLFRRWDIKSISELNSFYFILGDSGYKKIGSL